MLQWCGTPAPAAEHPGIETVVIDTADADSITTDATDVLTRSPALNVLVAMAGIMEPEDVHTAAFLSVAERTVTTNLLGPIRLPAAFVQALTSRPHAAIISLPLHSSPALKVLTVANQRRVGDQARASVSFTRKLRQIIRAFTLQGFSSRPADRTTWRRRADVPGQQESRGDEGEGSPGAPRRQCRQVPDQRSQGYADVHRGQDDDCVRDTTDSR